MFDTEKEMSDCFNSDIVFDAAKMFKDGRHRSIGSSPIVDWSSGQGME